MQGRLSVIIAHTPTATATHTHTHMHRGLHLVLVVTKSFGNALCAFACIANDIKNPFSVTLNAAAAGKRWLRETGRGGQL